MISLTEEENEELPTLMENRTPKARLEQSAHVTSSHFLSQRIAQCKESVRVNIHAYICYVAVLLVCKCNGFLTLILFFSLFNKLNKQSTKKPKIIG